MIKHQMEDFEALLNEASLYKKQYCKLVGLKPGTISRWRQLGVPGHAIAYLEKYIEVENLKVFIKIKDKTPAL